MTIASSFYPSFAKKVDIARSIVGRPLALSEKILYAHLYDGCPASALKRLQDYACFRPDRVAMQDATAQMALLQFMNAGKEAVCVPSSVHCDHLIRACEGVKKDLPDALQTNAEVYDFLRSAAARYGIDFWKPGAGIIHQTVLENYAFPGGMMVGTDSHTPNAGGLGMVAIGVGGADAVDVMSGMEWELKVPAIIGVRLSGRLHGWASAKDVILKLAGILSVKGGTNSIIEYFGEGTSSLSCTGKATICNMGAEVGATTSLFPFDAEMAAYLKATGRGEVAEAAAEYAGYLAADPGAEAYYDRIIDIDLDSLEPYVNGPFTPDAATPLSEMKARVAEKAYPETVDVALIGSCTNSSYQDLSRAASVAKQALDAGLNPKARIIVNPGSERIKRTAERDGILRTLQAAGAVVMTNACGPCIGQWKREGAESLGPNSIVTSFNRNFAKRADGNPNTHAFIVSPEMAVAAAFGGRLGFDPRTDSIDGFRFGEPSGECLPERGFEEQGDGCIKPADGSPEPIIAEGSERLQKLVPFTPWDGNDFKALPLLVKTAGKCTTDHISMAGPWLRYRGHLSNISCNLLLGAVDAFTGKAGTLVPTGLQHGPQQQSNVAARAKAIGASVIVAEDNYGEGSSREHAAMEPRFLGVRAVIAKSFARIHETNLKKQGVLALTFAEASDYAKVREGDTIDIRCSTIAPGNQLEVVLHHIDGSVESIPASHTYNAQQIGWFKAGSALNSLCLK